MKIKGKQLTYVSFVLPILLAMVCLLFVTINNHQSILAIPMPQEFLGEYSYDGESWQPLTADADLSALKGDLHLRGTFLREMGEGWQLNAYLNHISIAVKVNGELIYVDDALSIPDLQPDIFASICGRKWLATLVPAIGPEDTIEMTLHNPHRMGNRTAYRDFLATLCSDPVEWSILELNLAHYGDRFRMAGTLFVVASFMLLGASIAAVIVGIPVGTTLLKLGLLTLFSGGYITFDTLDVAYWGELTVFNTYGGYLCMMMAAFCLAHFVSDQLTGKRGEAARIAAQLSALLNSILIALSFTGVIVIYDTLPYWAAAQALLSVFFMVCCALEVRGSAEKKLIPLSGILLFGAILLDIFGIGSHIVWRAPISKITFALLFIVHIVAGARLIIANYHDAVRAVKLEHELEDSRIAIMLSQIKPHFLYNVLNTIYHLYPKAPEEAQAAVSTFADYLRTNMLSIEKNEPIPFSEEFEHIRTYLSLEQIRFRGKLQVVYDVQETNFKLPPLTIEPLVENAVKHGVTKKRGGGTVTISTRTIDEGIEISVIDDGVGFDPNGYMDDGKPHVGIRNVRNRLHNMVGGRLTITSSDKGTIACVVIPHKEGGNTK